LARRCCFNPEGVLSLGLVLPGSAYPDWRRVSSFYMELLERVQALPGVRSASLAYDLPLESNWIESFSVEGRASAASEEKPSARFRPVSPTYFQSLGIPLLAGRDFTDRERPGRPGVAIINEALARRHFPDESPLGKRLAFRTPQAIWRQAMSRSFEIVGMVEGEKFLGLNVDAEPAFYLPAWQIPLNDMSLLVRAESHPLALLPGVRREIASLDPDLPLRSVSTLSDRVDREMAQPRFNTMLVRVFCGAR